MSMKQIESGFQTISNALKTGQFSKRDLEFIVAFSESVKRGATNVLNRIAPNSEKVELAPTHNSAILNRCENETNRVDCGKLNVLRSLCTGGTHLPNIGAASATVHF